MSIYASRPTAPEPTRGIHPCPRCGLKRNARRNATLCRDCRECMTRVEIARWAA